MDSNDRKAIDALFEKVAEAEHQGGERDAEAEAYIRSKVEAQPASPYYMGQAIVMLEDALTRSNERIAALEQDLENRPAGGFLSSIFGGGNAAPSRPAAPEGPSHAGVPQPMGQGRGFLGSAAGTGFAMMGGALLGYGLASSVGTASADQPSEAEAGAGLDEAGGGDIGGGDFDLDF